MTAEVALFKKTAAGLLTQIAPNKAEQERQGRRCSRLVLTADVLWTDAEEAARDAEEAEAAEEISNRDEADQERATNRGNALQKLRALGLTDAEVVALVG
jgi:hypothetical protein